MCDEKYDGSAKLALMSELPWYCDNHVLLNFKKTNVIVVANYLLEK